MNNVLMGAEVIVSILLIVVVVLQSSKSSGMGAVGGSDSSFGGKGTWFRWSFVPSHSYFRCYFCCA